MTGKKTAAKKASPAAKRGGKASNEIRSQAEQKKDNSDDIERAVYDGMQDLSVKKPAGK